MQQYERQRCDYYLFMISSLSLLAGCIAVTVGYIEFGQSPKAASATIFLGITILILTAALLKIEQLPPTPNTILTLLQSHAEEKQNKSSKEQYFTL